MEGQYKNVMEYVNKDLNNANRERDYLVIQTVIN